MDGGQQRQGQRHRPRSAEKRMKRLVEVEIVDAEVRLIDMVVDAEVPPSEGPALVRPMRSWHPGPLRRIQHC